MDGNADQSSGPSEPQAIGGQDSHAQTAGVAIVGAKPAYDGSSAAGAGDEASEDLDELWVNKAKDIVDRTKGDPFAQSNELNKVRAEFLKARFNKHIKPGEESP